MAKPHDRITIGELAERTGVATSAIRFYESIGLLTSERTEGNQRRFRRGDIRMVSVIRAAQAVGLTLDEVGEALAQLPSGKTPTARDWERMSKRWQEGLDDRIAALERLRDDLSSCIGCGCLSLQTCALFNQDDMAGTLGSGARYLMGDSRTDAETATAAER